MSGFAFISHASEDKRGPVRTLVQALALEGLELFVDRPGRHDPAKNDMGLPEDFIKLHGIRSLPIGIGYDEGLKQALREAGAVLLCVSASAIRDREVLRQEVAYAEVSGKLLTCVIDDTRIGQVGGWGMVQVHMKQAVPVDIAGLDEALAWLDQDPARRPAELPDALRAAWEAVRLLVRTCRAVRPLVLNEELLSDIPGLLKLLEDLSLPPALVRRMYLRALPDANRISCRADTYARMLAVLADSQPKRPGRPSPLFEFVERLGRERPENKLCEWVWEHCESLQCLTMREDLDREGQPEAWATIIVDIDDEKCELFWRVHSEHKDLQDLCTSEKKVSYGAASDLCAVLGRVLWEADEFIGGRARTRVALLLSYKQLLERPDNWSVVESGADGLGYLARPLCRRWPVTLHWQNRFRKNGSGPAITAWKAARRELQARTSAQAAVEVVWAEAEEARDGRAAGVLLSAEGHGDCLGVDAGDALKDFIRQCLRQGVPYVIWFAQPGADPAGYRVGVDAVFGAHVRSEVPWRAGQQRLNANAGEPLEHLSILWDLPEYLGLFDS